MVVQLERQEITAGYDLPARHVIHTVGPVWHGGQSNEDELLASCYQQSCALAIAHGLSSLAFPCISTGVYRFPKERAARIALVTLRDELAQHASLGPIICCCFFGRRSRNLSNALPAIKFSRIKTCPAYIISCISDFTNILRNIMNTQILRCFWNQDMHTSVAIKPRSWAG